MGHTTERSQLDAWVKLETYETSLDRQTDDAKVVNISSCTADESVNFFFLNGRQAEMHILQTHRETTYGHKIQCLTQPKPFGIQGSSNRKEVTSQLRVQPMTRSTDPDRCPEDKASMPNIEQIIEDVPDTIYIEKAGDNQSKTSTSGNEVGSRCQTEKMTHVESSLMEKAHQAFYSSSHEEETIELVQTRTGNINPDKTCKPRVRPLIEMK